MGAAYASEASPAKPEEARPASTAAQRSRGCAHVHRTSDAASRTARPLARSRATRALNTAKDLHVPPARLKQLGRHKSYTPLAAYIEEGDLFADNALSGVLQTNSQKALMAPTPPPLPA